MVELTIQSPSSAARKLAVRRQHVEVPSIDDVKIVDRESGIGYLKLTCFQKTTSRDLDAALWRLNREGMRSLIMDLRGNPGGLLTSSVEVVDKFVDEGVIVSTRGRSSLEDYNYTAHKAGTWDVPLVVLIDGDSASASEIFAGAIRDHRRGTIVGQRSYGKGSVQGIFPLTAGRSGRAVDHGQVLFAQRCRHQQGGSQTRHRGSQRREAVGRGLRRAGECTECFGRRGRGPCRRSGPPSAARPPRHRPAELALAGLPGGLSRLRRCRSGISTPPSHLSDGSFFRRRATVSHHRLALPAGRFAAGCSCAPAAKQSKNGLTSPAPFPTIT